MESKDDLLELTVDLYSAIVEEDLALPSVFRSKAARTIAGSDTHPTMRTMISAVDNPHPFLEAALKYGGAKNETARVAPHPLPSRFHHKRVWSNGRC